MLVRVEIHMRETSTRTGDLWRRGRELMSMTGVALPRGSVCVFGWGGCVVSARAEASEDAMPQPSLRLGLAGCSWFALRAHIPALSSRALLLERARGPQRRSGGDKRDRRGV